MSLFSRRRGEGATPELKSVAQEVKEVIPPGYEAWVIKGKPVEIFSKKEVLAGIWEHCASSRQTRQEVGGMLYGQILSLPDNKQKCYIEGFEPMYDPYSHERGFNFKAQEVVRVRQLAINKYHPSLQSDGWGVGWYHTHLKPDSQFFFLHQIRAITLIFAL